MPINGLACSIVTIVQFSDSRSRLYGHFVARDLNAVCTENTRTAGTGGAVVTSVKRPRQHRREHGQ